MVYTNGLLYGIFSSMSGIKKFVIQKHERKNQDVHWDLMLEAETALETYRLELPPEKVAEQSTTAIRISDHPLKFLTYQGTVNNGLGTVEIVHTGTYKQLEANEKYRRLLLDSQTLQGQFTLTHIDSDRWQFQAL